MIKQITDVLRISSVSQKHILFIAAHNLLFMEFLATTVQGFEDLAAGEIERLGGKIMKIFPGKVVFGGEEELIYTLNFCSKLIFRLVILFAMDEVQGLEDIRKIVRETGPVIRGTFGVETKRKGEHDFTSMDISAVVGEELLKKSPEAKVYLDAPQHKILCWLDENLFFCGLDTTGESLHRRGYRVYQHPAPINPVLAALLVKWSSWNTRRLVDPFCGSGTILIEAYHLRNRVPNLFRDFKFLELPIYDGEMWSEIREKCIAAMRNTAVDLIGIERFRKHVEGCKMNAKSARAKILCIQGLAERMHNYVDYAPQIITNPPFGLRIGSKKKIFRLYEDFAEELEEYFSGSELTIIMPFTKFEAYFHILEKRNILYGNLHVNAYRFRV